MKRLLIAALIGCAAVIAMGQERLPEYDQARKFSATNLSAMLFTTNVDPHWTPQGDKFYYSYKTSEGTFWYLVDPIAKKKELLFDREWMAARLTEIVKDPYVAEQLPIQHLEAQEDGTFTFDVTSSQYKENKNAKKVKLVFYFSYDPAKQLLVQLDKEKADVHPDWASVSPDGKKVVYAKNLNLYMMSREDYEKARINEKDTTIVETQLTTWGKKDFGFGQGRTTLNTDNLLNGKRKKETIIWSPDSRHFAVKTTDSRHVGDLWVINAIATPRPTLESYKYFMAGEKNAPKQYLFVFNAEDGTYKQVNVDRFKDQTLYVNSVPTRQNDRDRHEVATVWTGNNEAFYVNRYSRDLHKVDVCKYVLGEDTLRTVIEERLNTYIETNVLLNVSNGKELIHWSERTGWGHLYLYDAEGNLKNAITSGTYHVDEVLNVDEQKRVIYFVAMGKKEGKVNEDEWNPYYPHLYRVNFDGTGLKALTKGNFAHTTVMDDKCRYFVDNYSRVNTIPCAAVYDNNGNKLLDLEESDFSKLLAAGYQFPEPFRVKAADGITDLYGVLYKPFNFDSTKVYPIIDYVYPGPQKEATRFPFTRMSVRTDRLAQAGFIVISVGNRGGSPKRSKWYHNYGYGNLRDYGLADQKAAIEQLANRYDFIDINRVGIHGHSGGGFMTCAAMLQYPDFFKVGVSAAGNHDNNIYNRWWSETHHGVTEEISEKGDTTFIYKIETTPSIAMKLKGNLLLIHGDIDDNVHPANTMRMVNALIKARKRFDMLFLPTQRHTFGNMDEYYYWRLVDYFSEHFYGRKETMIDIPGM